jgi:hypothetical protein
MDMWQSRLDRLSRRQLFAAAAVFAAARAADAQTKASRQEAAYQPGPKDHFSCAMCSLFRPPHACEVVSGDISPNGWCKFFVIPD